MKIFSLLTLLLINTTIAMAAPTPPRMLRNDEDRQVLLSINSVFVPGGFDSNSESYAVVSGIFPNGCYRWDHADVKNTDPLTHEVRLYARVQQGLCLMVLIPYTKEVTLGRMQSGHHTLRFVSGDGTFLDQPMDIE